MFYNRNQLKSWESTFLLKGIGLFEKPIIVFGSAFSDIGLKSQRLGLGAKESVIKYFFKDFMISDLFLKYFLHLIFNLKKTFNAFSCNMCGKYT